MKIIKIDKCFDNCPHCTGPDYNKEKSRMMFTCQEIPEWIDNEDTIPDWCPLIENTTYKSAGVDIDAGNELVRKITPLVRTSFKDGVVTDIGGFSGLFSFDSKKYKNPILVSSTDGVGTKLKIAFMMDKHNTIGIDLVAMCVNDVVALGAEPLFFLDYISTGKLFIDKVEQIIQGIVNGCKEAGCSLIGGETAEMPSFYSGGAYDLAGFVVGIVDYDNIIDGATIKKGDELIGIASSGLHSNGYSLVRKILFDDLNLDVNSKMVYNERSVGDELLTPTKIYVKTILSLINEFNIHGVSHITGGGLEENITRILPEGHQAVVYIDSWDIPPIFEFIKNKGSVSKEEMFKTFNNGIGMVIVVPLLEVSGVLMRLKEMGEEAYPIGEITQIKSETETILI